MGIDTTININPERVATLHEAETIIEKIDAYAKEKQCDVGVVLIQNSQFGAHYRILCEQEATDGLKKRDGYDWIVRYFPRSYFEELSKKLR